MPIKINGATSGSTTITAPATGGDESIELSTALASKLDLAGGKILQIVRATDSTDRSTTSTTFVDANMSVTITPQKSDSELLILASFFSNVLDTSSNSAIGLFRLTDSSNNVLSGAENMQTRITAGGAGSGVTDVRLEVPVVMLGRVTPATTSAVTYKLQFRQSSATNLIIENATNTGQMYAIEVSA